VRPILPLPLPYEYPLFIPYLCRSSAALILAPGWRRRSRRCASRRRRWSPLLALFGEQSELIHAGSAHVVHNLHHVPVARARATGTWWRLWTTCALPAWISSDCSPNSASRGLQRLRREAHRRLRLRQPGARINAADDRHKYGIKRGYSYGNGSGRIGRTDGGHERNAAD